ncbi:MAG TPA: KH domain-containing protein [Bacilli bacterium]|nr:KH domain-containing protein [Bacilli bacterium]
MQEINYEKFLCDLIQPLVLFPEEVAVKVLSEEDNTIMVQIIVNPDDIGRIIGRKGRVINSIRTIAYASASRFGKKIEISVDSF